MLDPLRLFRNVTTNFKPKLSAPAGCIDQMVFYIYLFIIRILHIHGKEISEANCEASGNIYNYVKTVLSKKIQKAKKKQFICHLFSQFSLAVVCVVRI